MQKLARKLISFESDKNHPKEIKRCFDFTVKYLQKRGLKVKIYSSNSRPSLVAARKLKKKYKYILNGHLDVVPADYKKAFEPFVKNGRLYGRGASDMKGVDAAMIRLICDKDLKDVDMALMLTCDEEIGGFDGVKYLLKKKKYRCNCVVIPDGGNNFSLINKQKGFVQVLIRAKGKSAHGSRPWLGNNAIEGLMEVYKKVRKFIPKTNVKNRWKPTLNIGKINGGLAANQVAPYCEMYLDIRCPTNKQKEKIVNYIKKICSKNNNLDFTIPVDGEIMFTNKNNQYSKKIFKIAKDNKIEVKFDREHGGSDARFFSAKNIPVIMFLPKCSEAHIDNEWINLKSLEKFRIILKEFLLS